jgi:hypothetical protein
VRATRDEPGHVPICAAPHQAKDHELCALRRENAGLRSHITVSPSLTMGLEDLHGPLSLSWPLLDARDMGPGTWL